MVRTIIHKSLLLLTIVTLLFMGPSCHKQAKCGCKGDKLSSYSFTDNIMTISSNSNFPWITYSTTGSSAYISLYGYAIYPDIYTFCNPGEMYAQYAEAVENGTTTFVVSGDVFWNCNYSMSADDYGSSSSYYYPRYFDVRVTSIEPYANGPYGK